MAIQYNFLAHSIFIENLDEFRKIADKTDLKSLDTQFRKCIADPINAGKRIHPGGIDLVGGSAHRLHINGPDGYRLIYYANPKKKIVIGVYISLVRRQYLDYDKIQWEALTDKLIKEFGEKNYEAFKYIR